jgi:RNA ligase
MIARKESDDGRILYNYTDRAQYSQIWTDETRLCRGLVTDTDGCILARPFPKFWNLSEHASPDLPDIPDEPFTVTDKLDGSLICVYLHRGKLAVNTRGSFTSDQALAAREWLAEYSWAISKGETWLFEWIAPDNRIVVDYGQRRECVLLDVIDNATGRSIKSLNSRHPFAEAESIPVTDLDSLPDRENAEGYVVRFRSGMRVKVKHPRYVAIHRALNGLNEHRVWEMLRKGTSFDELLEIVPDESYKWLDATKSALEQQFAELLARSEHEFNDILTLIGEDGNRKEFAAMALKSDLRAVLFALLDDKPEDRVHDLIWKMIEP